MPDSDEQVNNDKAQAFFARGEQVADTDNFDYAIDMYLQGLSHSPDDVEKGHQPLRRIGLIRQGKGGKKPSMVDKMRRRGGKDPLEEMLNAEYLLAKDPDNLGYAEDVLKAAAAGKYVKTGKWIAQLVFEANRARKKPSVSTYLLLKDCYQKMELFSQAIVACQCASELKPDDDALRDELRDLSAQMTMKRGGYDKEGDFRKAIVDREQQERLHSQDQFVKSADFRTRSVELAREELAKNPKSAVNILKLADVLYELETQEGFDEAMVILAEAYDLNHEAGFKRREGELRIKRLKHRIREIKGHGGPESKEKIASLGRELEKVELEHFKFCIENYPTDLRMKYEYGVRLVRAGIYDEAIPLFQEAQKEPRSRLSAMNMTGFSFFKKGWYSDAVDIFSQAFEQCEVKDNAIAKEIRYNLARSHEEEGNLQEALEIYRKLAQLDFGYKDVRLRVDNLRKRKDDQPLSSN